jgi:hypothetical protein
MEQADVFTFPRARQRSGALQGAAPSDCGDRLSCAHKARLAFKLKLNIFIHVLNEG